MKNIKRHAVQFICGGENTCDPFNVDSAKDNIELREFFENCKKNSNDGVILTTVVTGLLVAVTASIYAFKKCCGKK